jgi:hypothetical protein
MGRIGDATYVGAQSHNLQQRDPKKHRIVSSVTFTTTVSMVRTCTHEVVVGEQAPAVAHPSIEIGHRHTIELRTLVQVAIRIFRTVRDGIDCEFTSNTSLGPSGMSSVTNRFVAVVSGERECRRQRGQE